MTTFRLTRLASTADSTRGVLSRVTCQTAMVRLLPQGTPPLSAEPIKNIGGLQFVFSPEGQEITFIPGTGIDRFLCDILERGATGDHPRIPPGRYRMTLRTVGEKHAAYLAKYGADFHKGMIEILVEGREAILIHVGNFPKDSLGCLLCGWGCSMLNGNWYVGDSDRTYRRIYPIIADAITAGETWLEIAESEGV